MPDMTPIRVRGKRGAARAEKWHAGKKRKASRDSSPVQMSDAVSVSSNVPSAASSRKRKRRQRSLSTLEELPTEILQDIFYYAANLNLALASPGLQAQLSSKHVYLKHTSRIMQPVIGHPGDSKASDADLSAATRLLNCKFMTWSFFKLWLNEHWELRKRSDDREDNIVSMYCSLWSPLEPSHGLVPPRKILHGPWTQDKIDFLEVLAFGIGDLPALSPVSGEVAHEGLAQAVAESSVAAVRSLLTMGLRPDTEVLRQAVINHGCKEAIVRVLVEKSGVRHSEHEQSHQVDMSEVQGSDPRPGSAPSIDFLDPALWSWADRARIGGDGKGQWLMDLLKAKARAIGLRGSTPIEPANGPNIET
ncbi:hypothetical protein LTR36_000347 [Oleoguttula mirabilis]|uniref:F-box domain-containing protein n=1 Tax=Oleoguttula mirabilis TaxID=1507867 RepID=A0AAV9JYA1_9PEZI|nr:hypothetical protein LTR36_000347 [Oleoguttula mirabilis]